MISASIALDTIGSAPPQASEAECAIDIAHVSKRFKLGKTELETYLDVQNVTNHSNAEEVVYNTNYTQKNYITGLPVLPVVGARFSW